MTDSTETSTTPEPSPLAFAFGIVEARMQALVRREEDVDFAGQRSARTTHLITQGATLVSVLLTPVIFYLIISLILSMGIITERMEAMVGQVDGMRTNFDEVTLRMATIDASVSKIATHVGHMPDMEQNMRLMHRNFADMTRTMEGIAPNMQLIDQTLAGMDFDIAQMNNVFSRMNMSVLSIGRDVNTMSSPMRMLPFFGR